MLIQNDTIFEFIVSDSLYKIPDEIVIRPNDVIEIPDFKCTDIDIKGKSFRRMSTKNVLKIRTTYEKIFKYKKDNKMVSNSWCYMPPGARCISCFKHCYKKNIDEYAEYCEKCNSYITTNEYFYKCYHNINP